ncbi:MULTISPECIES: hypothetical protein [Pseudomonadota]|uniref:hypothetical protein n=1 Tax=Pseudomonadota TaxID=1224 RepID=UPI001981CBAE|nr:MULTISPECIES: hypothetical protein [Pseudomonadota]MCT5279709.1 hypothetical protein [Pseudomonas aeruginosa]WBM13067.1 hypothetical protein M2J77_26950 [Pseudomonas aeruginosa]
MALPSFDSDWKSGERVKPRICVLEIRDRDKPESDPIAWLFIERQETCRRDERDGSVYEASFRLSYERVAPKHSYRMSSKGYFSGGYSRGFGDTPSVSLTSESTSKGAVFLDLPGLEGQRIGTYLMNEIVLWVRQWPEASVRSIELLSGQAHDENKARRNRFYEQFGLVFDYSDPEQCEGLSKPMLAGALTPVETWKQNLRERDVREYLGEVLYERNQLAFEMSQRERAIKNLSEEIKRAEARPVRWALRRLWWRFVPSLTHAAILLILGAMAWVGLKSK